MTFAAGALTPAWAAPALTGLGARVPLPLPRPAELDDEAAPDPADAAEAPSPERAAQPDSAPQAQGWWAPPPAPSPPPEPAEAAPLPEPGPARTRVAALPKGDVPLPEPRPLEADGAEDVETDERVAPLLVPPPPPSGSATGGGSTAPAPAAPLSVAGLPPACAALVDAQVILAVRAPPVRVSGGCSLPEPVRMSGVRLKDGSFVRLTPSATLRCETAIAVADWVREDIAEAAAGLGSKLEAVKVAASYDCRPRNRVRGAKMSQHGLGNAFDLGGFVLEDRRVFDVKGGLSGPLQTVLKESACARFTTVLGPGSDGYHEDHVHVDTEQRRLDVRLCRWRIRESGPVIARAAPAAPATAVAPADTAGAPPAAADEAGDMPTNVPLPPRRPHI